MALNVLPIFTDQESETQRGEIIHVQGHTAHHSVAEMELKPTCLMPKFLSASLKLNNTINLQNSSAWFATITTATTMTPNFCTEFHSY